MTYSATSEVDGGYEGIEDIFSLDIRILVKRIRMKNNTSAAASLKYIAYIIHKLRL